MEDKINELIKQISKFAENQQDLANRFTMVEEHQIQSEKVNFEKTQDENNSAKIKLMFRELEEGKSATEILRNHTVYFGKVPFPVESNKNNSITITTTIIGAFVTLCVAIITFCGNQKQITVAENQGKAQIDVARAQADSQVKQKEVELQIAKVERLERLIGSLASEKPEEKKYATFAAISLGIGDFDKFVLSSLANIKDRDTLNALIGRIKDRSDLQDELKYISRYYSRLSEIEYENNDIEVAFDLADFALKVYPVNAQANYRIGRKLQIKGSNPISTFEKALSDLKESNADAKPDLEISINERLGEYLYSVNDESGGQTKFRMAKEILETYAYKNKSDLDRLVIIDGCLQSKRDCNFK